MRGAYSLPLREFLGLKHKQEHQQKRELSQPFNPAAKPGGSYKRPSRRPPGGQSQLRLKHGEMDTFTADLISWVAGGCQPLAWETLVARKDELEAPTWLDGEILGLDSISHKVLALSLAHLVHLQGGLDNSPFEPGQDLDGGYLIQVLNLSSPHGVWELAKRLGTDSPLRTRGYLEVDREWSTRQKRNGSSPISVARFLKTDISLSVNCLGSLLGLEKLDVEDLGPSLEDLALPQAVRSQLGRLLENPPELDCPFIVYLKGTEQSGRRTLAKCLAKHFNRTLKSIRPSDGPQPGAFAIAEIPSHFDSQDFQLIKEHPSWLFLKPMEKDLSFDPESRAALVLDLGPLFTDERTILWNRQMQEAGPSFSALDITELAALDAAPGRIVEAVKRLSRSSAWEELSPEAVQERLKVALTSGKSEVPETTHAEKLKPVRSLDELCLAPEAMTRFKHILQAIRGRKEMLANWKLDPGLVGHAQGVMLFHGLSGTGKSMAAEVLAHELELPLLRMEAAEIESPYVGESESRLQKFFASVKGKPAVLLLDEVDTVLMNRSTTTGSTKRYQDNFVNTFLRELDRFEGILVLTSNHPGALDPAVERRIQFRMAFESPSAEVRAQIWKTLLGDAPIPGRQDLDFSLVAEHFPFSGGRIRNAFMDACQRAAEAGAISQDILLAACEEEQRSSIATQPFRIIRGFSA